MGGRSAAHGRNGPGSIDRSGWVGLAEARLLEIINQELAAPHAELEGRLWEIGVPPGTPKPMLFFPHIVDEALKNLTLAGQITKVDHPTKGGKTVELYAVVDPGRGRQTAIEKALSRKGMLYARFLSYSDLFGAAGETVVRESLSDAIPRGYMSMNTDVPFGEVKKVGTAAFAGPLDSGAWLTTIDPATALPGRPHAVMIEVKNRRLTLYPRHAEVHQLLHKAAVVQNAHPDQPIVPMLICRRAHDRLFWMAKDLGFHVHQTRRQFLTLPPKTDVKYLEQIKDELALRDLTLVSTTSRPRIETVFTTTLPKHGSNIATRWAAVGSTLTTYYAQLRSEKPKPWERNTALAQLRTQAEIALDQAGVDEKILAWALEENEDDDWDNYDPD
jgi:hypothetical protein